MNQEENDKRIYTSKTVRLSKGFLRKVGQASQEGESLEATLRRLLNWEDGENSIVYKYVTESSGDVLPFARYEELVLVSSAEEAKRFWSGQSDSFGLIGMWLELREVFKIYPLEAAKLKNNQVRWKARIKNAVRRLKGLELITLDGNSVRGDWQYQLTTSGEKELAAASNSGRAEKKLNVLGFMDFIADLQIEMAKDHDITEAFGELKEAYSNPYE
jgi:hypothetical protein